jgi:SAM-dependent methyltransferase
LLPDRFKGLFNESSNPRPTRRGSAQEEKETHIERQSRGLDQFFFNIRGLSGLSLLDLGGAVQENIEFVTNLGHRVTTQAFLQTLDQTFGRDAVNEHSHPDGIESFLNQNLAFPDATFDGVLLWDTLQYISPALLAATISELYRVTRPGSYMLAFFNSDDKTQVSPNTKFRIVDANMIRLMQKGTRRQAQSFNNRNLEKLFSKFDSVKFFLTRESLREVIIRR